MCGEVFEAHGEYRGFPRKFCSRRCAGEAARQKRIAAYPPREEVERLYREEGLSDRDLAARFGRSYQWAYMMRRHYGIGGVRGGWRTRRGKRVRAATPPKAVFNLAVKGEDRCRNCGRKDRGLNLHHAIPRSMHRHGRAELLNGVPLCIPCHMGWHRRDVTIYRDVFTEEEWRYLLAVRLLGQVTRTWLDERYPDRGRELREAA